MARLRSFLIFFIPFLLFFFYFTNQNAQNHFSAHSSHAEHGYAEVSEGVDVKTIEKSAVVEVED